MGRDELGQQTCEGNIQTLKVTDILGTVPTFSKHGVFINSFRFLCQRINQGILLHSCLKYYQGDGNSKYVRKVGNHLLNYTKACPKRQEYEYET